jgi:enoyl-CoA hydratase/carnithine racemase
MAYEFATYEKQGRIAIVTINRPERMNALHPPANFELHEIWNDFERDPDVWVGILTGAGDKAFSAGNDLRFTAEHGRDMVRMAESGFGGLANRTTNWKPILAAVNGYALGGVHRLPRMIPQKIAMGYILTGRHMTAQEAHRLGVVNEVVPRAELMSTALRWANEILECAPLSIRASKQAALMGLGHPLDIALKLGYTEAERMRRSEDTVEGPRAFAEKRKPNWKAR